MYAIIRTGGKQSKVREGDIIDVERLRADGEVTFTPVLVVDAKGKVFSSRGDLATAKVTAKVLGESSGEKIDIFKYKAKTGYRRRGGHRQRYTQIEVTKIQPPKAGKASDDAAEASEPAAVKTAEEKPAAKKPAAKKPAAKKPAAKKAEEKPAATKPAAKKPAAKKPAAKKPAAKKPAAKKPAAKKDSPESKGDTAEKEG